MSEGERILFFRTKQKKSRRELSGLSGVSESAIKQYETGKRQPKTEQLKRIADALGVNVGVLLYGENFMTIDSDGVKYYGPYIPKEEIDEDKEGIFRTAVKPAFREVGGAFVDALDEVTSSIVDVLQNMTEENKLLFLELAKKMSKREGGENDK